MKPTTLCLTLLPLLAAASPAKRTPSEAPATDLTKRHLWNDGSMPASKPFQHTKETQAWCSYNVYKWFHKDGDCEGEQLPQLYNIITDRSHTAVWNKLLSDCLAEPMVVPNVNFKRVTNNEWPGAIDVDHPCGRKYAFYPAVPWPFVPEDVGISPPPLITESVVNEPAEKQSR